MNKLKEFEPGLTYKVVDVDETELSTVLTMDNGVQLSLHQYSSLLNKDGIPWSTHWPEHVPMEFTVSKITVSLDVDGNLRYNASAYNAYEEVVRYYNTTGIWDREKLLSSGLRGDASPRVDLIVE